MEKSVVEENQPSAASRRNLRSVERERPDAGSGMPGQDGTNGLEILLLDQEDPGDGDASRSLAIRLEVHIRFGLQPPAYAA